MFVIETSQNVILEFSADEKVDHTLIYDNRMTLQIVSLTLGNTCDNRIDRP